MDLTAVASILFPLGLVLTVIALVVRRQVYRLFSSRFSVKLEEEILTSLETSGWIFDLVKIDDYLIIAASDKRMIDRQSLFTSEELRQPQLILYEKQTGLLPDMVNLVFALGNAAHFRKLQEIEFADPNGNRFFFFDDVRQVRDIDPTISVMLVSYNGASAGTKYLSIIGIQTPGKRLGHIAGGPYRAFTLPSGAGSLVLTSTGPLVANLAQGFKFTSYRFEDAVFWSDIDGDGQEELVMALMMWRMEAECHWCPHDWIIAVNDWTPRGFRTSRRFCDRGSIVLTKEKLGPTEVSGMHPRAPGLLGMVPPAAFLNRNRDIKLANDVLTAVLRRDGACESWPNFLAKDLSDVVGFEVTSSEDFDPGTWPRRPLWAESPNRSDIIR